MLETALLKTQCVWLIFAHVAGMRFNPILMV